MKYIQILILFFMFFGIQQIVFAGPVVSKKDLRGQWVLKTAACSYGKPLNQFKVAILNFDGVTLSLALKDEKSMKEEKIIDTNHFVIQEDLLTFSKSSNQVATVKLQKKAKTLLMKFPSVGIEGDCSESELMVWTFQRKK